MIRTLNGDENGPGKFMHKEFIHKEFVHKEFKYKEFTHKVKIRNVFANNDAEKYMMYDMMKLSDRQAGTAAREDERRNVWILL